MANLIKCQYCLKIHDREYNCIDKLKYKSKISRRRKKYMSEDNKLYNKFYSSSKWIKCRDEVLRDNNYMCEICMEIGIINYTDIQVHHIEKIRDNWNRRLDKDNLICVCRNHHNIIEGMNEEEIIEYVNNLK